MPVNITPANIPGLETPINPTTHCQCPVRVAHFENYYLGDDGVKFPTGGSDSMCGRAVTRGKISGMMKVVAFDREEVR